MGWRHTPYRDLTVPETPSIVLGEDSLHVWTLRITDDRGWPCAEAAALLSEDELRRARRFLRPDDGRLFTLAHVALRQTLSRYSPTPPQDWSFEIGEHGRPELRNAEVHDGLRFNLSHTPGLVAIVVNRSFDAGVDVEGVGRVADLAGMSRTSFSAAERSALLALPSAEQPLRFAKTWVLKESFIKALGTGLTTPLRSFSFDLSDPEVIRFSCANEIDADPSAWSFTVTQPSNAHVLATASRLGPAKTPPVRHFALHS